jgi:hypothetical protein
MSAAWWVLVGLVVLAWLKYRRYIERRRQAIQDQRRVLIQAMLARQLKEKHS